jgi:mannose-6-phosphate isomerase-like protein (cupin superfamily)
MSAPVVRGPRQVPADPLGTGVAVREMLNDQHGCRGLHQRRLRVTGGAVLGAAAGGRGEAWYVISGSGELAADVSGTIPLRPGTAVWMKHGLRYQARAGDDLEVLSVTIQAESAEDVPAFSVATLDACEPERTGDREFRVLLSSGLVFTQFAGMIPPGRAPEHHHTYDEVVHVLAGQGVVHLSGTTTEIGPGTSIYLPPYQPHCLENTGSDTLEVLGVFYPAGSPAAKQAT